MYQNLKAVQFSSVSQSCPTLCNPMNRSTPGLPVHHQLPEFTQTHVHRVSDAIQPSHPRSSPSPPAPNPSQHQSLSNESTLHMRWPEYWSFSFSIIPSKEHPGLVSFRMDWQWGPKKNRYFGTSLVVQWLRLHASTVGGTVSIPGSACLMVWTKKRKSIIIIF